MSPAATSRSHAAPRPPRRAGARAVASLAVAAALAACTAGGGSAEPQTPAGRDVATTSAPSPLAPTATPSVTAAAVSPGLPDFAAIDLTVAPTRPAALEQAPSEEAAAAVATYFVLLYPYTMVTRDLTAFRDVSYNDCGFCNRTIDRLRGYDAKGVRSEGGAIIVHEAAAEEISDDYYVVSVTISEDASRDVGADGTVLQEDAGSALVEYAVDVKWHDGEWLVMALTSG